MSRKDRKFKGFFRPKLGDLQKKKKKKKKGLRQNSGRFFSQFRKFKTFEGGLFSYGGGLFSIFHRKSALKSTKNMRFCILHKPMGGARAPPRPPPLATLLVSSNATEQITATQVFSTELMFVIPYFVADPIFS